MLYCIRRPSMILVLTVFLNGIIIRNLAIRGRTCKALDPLCLEKVSYAYGPLSVNKEAQLHAAVPSA